MHDDTSVLGLGMASTGAFDFDHDLAVDAEVDASGWAEEGGIEM